MPEGNVIHRLARAHDRDLAGRRLAVSAAQKRFAKEARALDGRMFDRAEARGKHLFHHWRRGPIVHIHLGMFGDFYRRELPAPPLRPTVRLRLASRAAVWDLIGPPTCEIVTRGRVRGDPRPSGSRSPLGAARRAAGPRAPQADRRPDRPRASGSAHRFGDRQHLSGRGALSRRPPSAPPGVLSDDGRVGKALDDGPPA